MAAAEGGWNNAHSLSPFHAADRDESRGSNADFPEKFGELSADALIDILAQARARLVCLVHDHKRAVKVHQVGKAEPDVAFHRAIVIALQPRCGG